MRWRTWRTLAVSYPLGFGHEAMGLGLGLLLLGRWRLTLCDICRGTMPPGAWTSAGSRLRPCFRHRECHAVAKRLDTRYSVRPQFFFPALGEKWGLVARG
jgi:hypothetical protein